MNDQATLRRALANSRVGGLGERIAGGSRLLAAIENRPTVGAVMTTGRSWLDGSILGQFLGRLERGGGRLFAGAWVVAAIGRVGQWPRSSWLFRWLTAEPEPDVIVIDLRETVTVGPALIAIDEAIGVVVLGRRTSIVGAAATAVSREVRDAPIRLLSIGLLLAIVASTLVGLVRGMDAAGLWVRAIVAALALAGTRIGFSWETIRESRPVRITIALLEPPEPPEGIEADERESVRDDREE